MTRDKKVLYAISASLLVVLLLAFFIPYDNGRIVAAVLLVPAVAIVYFAIPKRTIHSINKWQVLLLVSAIAAVWAMLLFLSGAYFGFLKTPSLSWERLLGQVLPITLSIIAVEIIRSVILAQKNRITDLLAYFIGTLSEILIFADFAGVDSINRFMEVFGLVIIPAGMGNILYQYLSRRFGCFPPIAYRLILALYPYFITYDPLVPDAVVAFGLMLLPILAYLFIRVLFERKQVTHRKTGIWAWIGMGVTVLVMISIVMICSGRFRIGMLVIATESMTGEINKGDAIVYERYDGEVIEEGQVVIFIKSNARIVHRVVKIENIDGEVRYYTKGDALEEWDNGYITTADLFGTVKFKIAYGGYPTLWLHDVFAKD